MAFLLPVQCFRVMYIKFLENYFLWGVWPILLTSNSVYPTH